MESESVGSSEEEVTFSLLRFPVVNIKPVVLRSHRYPLASRYQREEVDRQQYEDEQTENDDHTDFLQYCWDGDGDEEYFNTLTTVEYFGGILWSRR
jgi:hypothetical protein